MARDSESIPFSAWKDLTPSYTGSGTRVFSSFLNSVFGRAMSVHLFPFCFRLRKLIGNQFRPDQMPVIRTKIASGNRSTGCALDRRAILRCKLSLPIAPETHRLGGYSENRSHLRRTAAEVNCFVDISHSCEFYTRRIKNQHSISTPVDRCVSTIVESSRRIKKHRRAASSE